MGAALDEITGDYQCLLQELGLEQDTPVFSRIYLSDIANQKKELISSSLYELLKNGSYSVIQQSPLGHGQVQLFAYHMTGDDLKKKIFVLDSELWRNALIVEGKNYTHLWTGNFSGIGAFDSFTQTDEIFRSYNELINDNAMTLLNNTVRTWIYVRDIDNHYQGMVDSRLEYFYVQGLTEKTRYIASTGIEAKLKECGTLVSMDALSIGKLSANQIVRMEALENLNPTYEYRVTFERGTRINFGDRSHFYISGTASINNKGEVLYLSDIEGQTHRTLDNISALLANQGATLADMAYLIVYLRNIKTEKRVRAILRERLKKHIPIIIVEGSVCRPTWLVEIEGVGVKAATFPDYGSLA